MSGNLNELLVMSTGQLKEDTNIKLQIANSHILQKIFFGCRVTFYKLNAAYFSTLPQSSCLYFLL